MDDTIPPRSAPGSPVRRYAGMALNVLLPPQCLSCHTVVDTPGRLCPDCWERVEFIAPPFCRCCGFPFEYDDGDDALCGACARARPPFERARAVMRYDEDSRNLILGFKHGDRTHGAPAYGAWMARAGAELLRDADLIVPVPLHWTRLLRRRFNQSALLAHAIGSLTAVEVAPDLLVRRRRTASQGFLSASARRRNVRGAFAINSRRRRLVGDARVVLVDDVLTSGATAEACTGALLRAGARSVDLLVLARVVRGGAGDR